MKQIPQKPRIIIAQVAGSGTSGATVSMEKVLPALSVKKARGAWKKEEDVNIWSDLLPNLPSFIRRVCSGFGPDWGGLQTRSV
jgi:hypothetical protein